MTTLCEAVKTANISRVKELLEQGADPNERDDKGNPSLVYAASRSFEFVELLVNAGADVNAKSRIGATAMDLCILGEKLSLSGTGYMQKLRFLIDNGADLEATGYGGKIPLESAEALGNAQSIKILRQAIRNKKARARSQAKRTRLSELHNRAAARQDILLKRRPRVTILKNIP